MATVVQNNSGHSVVSALTVTITMVSTGAGRLLVVTGASALNHTVNTVTDNIGNTYLQVPSAAASANSNADRTDCWYCANASAGVTLITITFNGTAGTFSKDGEAWEVSNFTNPVVDVVATANDINQVNGIDDPGSAGTVATTSTDGFIVAAIKTAPGGIIANNPRAGNEFSSGGDIATGALSAGCSLVSVTAANHKPVWDDGNSFINFCCTVVAFKASGGAAAPFTGSTVDTRLPYPDWNYYPGQRGFSAPAQIKLFGQDKFFGPAGKGPNYDWPNPLIKRPSIDLITDLLRLKFWLLKDTFFGGGGQPPSNHDFPNPILKTPNLELRSYLDPSENWLLKDKFFGVAGQPPTNYDWPNPLRPLYPILLRTSLVTLTETTLFLIQRPFFNLDWPNPLIPGRVRDLLTGLQTFPWGMYGKDDFFGLAGNPTYDFPNPRGYPFPIDLRTSLLNLQLTTLAKAPFQNYDWPNPRGYSYPSDLRTLLQSIIGTTLQPPPSPFYQTEWPNPKGYAYPSDLRTFLNSTYLLAGKDTFFGLAGNPLRDWPNPRGYGYPLELRTLLQSLVTTTLGIVIVPFSQEDWPNPRGSRHPHQGYSWSQPRTLVGKDQFFGAPGQPVTNYDWPVPPRPHFSVSHRTWTQSKMAPRTVPFSVVAWPNPAPAPWTSSLLTLTTVGNLALYYPVGPLPPITPSIDDDWFPGGTHAIPQPSRVDHPKRDPRIRQGRGLFRLPMPSFKGHGTLIASGDEEELLLFLLADET